MPLIQTRGSSVCLTHRCNEGNSLDRIIRFPLEAALVRERFPVQARSALPHLELRVQEEFATRAVMSLILKPPSDISINA